MKQRRRNRHIIQTQTVELSPTPQACKLEQDLREAHLLLNTLLNQADIKFVNEQMSGKNLSQRRRILSAWFDYVETVQKMDTLKENGSGTQAYWFTFFALESKVLNRREWAESL